MSQILARVEQIITVTETKMPQKRHHYSCE